MPGRLDSSFGTSSSVGRYRCCFPDRSAVLRVCFDVEKSGIGAEAGTTMVKEEEHELRKLGSPEIASAVFPDEGAS